MTRLGLFTKNEPELSASVKSVGYGDLLPDYIIFNLMDKQLNVFNMAYAGLDFDKTDSKILIQKDQIYLNISFNIFLTTIPDYQLNPQGVFSKNFFFTYTNPLQRLV